MTSRFSGLCFGGQVLADVLGGRIEAAPTPEFGWHEIDTDEPDAIPAGPWPLWHYQRFTVPPGATEVAAPGTPRRPSGHGRHLGLQFHLNSTTDIVEGWARKDAEKLGPSASRTPGAHRCAGRAQGCGEAGGVPSVRRLHRRERMIEERGLMARPPELSDQSVTSVRVVYSDLHGVTRGKDVPIGEFDRAAEHGLAFCSAIMGTDLRHTPVVGGEEGYPDLIAKPDLSTLTLLPWEPESRVASRTWSPSAARPPPPRTRAGAVRKAVAGFEELGYSPIVGPELEFFLCRSDGADPSRCYRHLDHPSMIYTVGPQADPDGLARQLTEMLSDFGLEAFALNHEFANSQYEINLREAPAVAAADRAFLFKSAVKDLAGQSGLIATFMGKPFNDQGGSGFHVHVSLNRNGTNAFADPDDPDGISDPMRGFVAGVLQHAPALMALLNPTVNAYRRLVPGSLAPTHANWGWDNRAAMVRVPPDRGGATRLEVRMGDGSANAYLSIAGVLFAGLHGVKDELELGPPVGGDAYTLSDPGEPRLPPAWTPHSTRSRPTRCCATPTAADRRHVPGHQALRASGGTARGCRTGAQRVPPPPLGRHDHAAADRPGRPRRVQGPRPQRAVQDPPRGGPGSRNPEEDGTGLYAVTRYHDIREVHRHTEPYSSELGGTLLEDLEPDQIEARKSMIDMDPPRHDELRG